MTKDVIITKPRQISILKKQKHFLFSFRSLLFLTTSKSTRNKKQKNKTFKFCVKHNGAQQHKEDLDASMYHSVFLNSQFVLKLQWWFIIQLLQPKTFNFPKTVWYYYCQLCKLWSMLYSGSRLIVITLMLSAPYCDQIL